MGWFAVYRALRDGRGPYGTVQGTLRGECDPHRALLIALAAIEREIALGNYCPDKKARARIAYWKRRVADDLP